MTAFFDIDTQIDFLFPAGALYTSGAEELIPTVARLNQYAASNGIPVISTMCAHGEDDAEFKVWPPHCIRGTVGQQKPAATIIATAQQIIIEKQELDAFSNPELVPLLDRLNIDVCFVYGVLTEFCVGLAVMGLLKIGRKVYLVTDAIAHQSEAEARRVIAAFEALGGVTVSSSAVVGRLQNIAAGGD